MVSKLEEQAFALIGHKRLTSATGKVSDRAKRRMNKEGEITYNILKRRKDKIFEREGLVVGLRWSDEAPNWARNISLALEELKQEDPKAYEKVQEKINKHRQTRRAYIEFGGDVPEGVYIGIVQDVMGGISYEKAKEIYEAIVVIEENLGKPNGLQRLLLSE